MALYGNITVDEMAARAWLTVREMNACKRYRLFDMNAVCEYYQTHNTFLQLDGIGNKANQNLMQLCRNLMSDLKNETKTGNRQANSLLPVTEPYAVVGLYKQMPDKQKTKAEAVYGQLVCSLQRRSIRALFMLYKSKKLSGFIKGIDVKPTAFAVLANALLPTGDNLNYFLEQLTQLLSAEANEDTKKTDDLHCLMQSVNKALRHRDKRMETFISQHAGKLKGGDFPVSDFLEVVILCNKTLPATYKKMVFCSGLFYKKNTPLSPEYLARQLGVQPSRVKQLLHNNVYRQVLFKELAAAVGALQICGLKTPQSFRLPNVSYHYFDLELPVRHTPFTNLMLASLFSFLNPKFRLFCIEKNGTTAVFFSHEKIEAWFDIVAFFNHIEKQISKRIVHDYCIRLPDFLLLWCKRAPSANEHTKLHRFALALLKAKYHLLTNPDGSLILYRTAKLTRREYIIDFLRTKNRPCTAEDILAHMQKTGSQMKMNSLITYLQSLKNSVQPLGNAMYGLYEWNEKIKKHCPLK